MEDKKVLLDFSTNKTMLLEALKVASFSITERWLKDYSKEFDIPPALIFKACMFHASAAENFWKVLKKEYPDIDHEQNLSFSIRTMNVFLEDKKQQDAEHVEKECVEQTSKATA